MVKNTQVSNTSDYISNATVYATLCASTASVSTANTGYDKWLDVYVKNESTCAAHVNSRIDYWILTRDLGKGAVAPVRFKSVYQGETSKSHIDLGEYERKDKSLQFIIVKEILSDAAACSKLTVQSANLANRVQLFPGSSAALKSTFDTRLAQRPGFANVWNWTDWRRAPVAARMMSSLQVPFFRTWLQGSITNIYGCNSNARAQGYDYRLCFANDTGLDQMDNAVEELFYRGVPIIANVHGTLLPTRESSN